MLRSAVVLLLLLLIVFARAEQSMTWARWWTYSEISGPDFWGLVNPYWTLCAKGQMQSPVDIIPRSLLFDPSLKQLHIDKQLVSGILHNTGRQLKWTLDDAAGIDVINVTRGPLTYRYRVAELRLHFGFSDDQGSEHTVDGDAFPGELQIVAYNSDVYGNLTQAEVSTHGLMIIGIFLTIGEPDAAFRPIADQMALVQYKDEQSRVSGLSIHDLVKGTTYMTYEGSKTEPPCDENVSWVIFNRPLSVSGEQMRAMRSLMRSSRESSEKSTTDKFMSPKDRPNARSTRPLHARVIRTNINISSKEKDCTMKKEMFYKVNAGFRNR